MRRINPRGLLALENDEQQLQNTPPTNPLSKPASGGTADQHGEELGEEIKQVVVGDHPITVELREAVDAVETDLADSSEENTDAQEVSEDIQNATDVVEALESIREVLQSSLPNGGLGKADAAPLKSALECLTSNIGMRAGVAFPALESFDSVSGRLRSTKLVLESIGEKAKEIWAKIIAAIKAAIKWLVERFQMFWYNAEKLDKRADAVIKMAEGVKGEAKEKTFKSAGLVNALHIDGKVKPLEGIKRLEEATREVGRNNEALVQSIKETMAKDDAELDVEKIGNGVLHFLDLSVKVEHPKDEGLTVQEGFELYRQPELPGAKCLLGELPGDKKKAVSNNEAADLLSHISVKLVDGWPKIQANTDQELDTLQPSDAAALAKQVKAVCGNIIAGKKIIEGYTKAKEEILKKAEELQKAAGDGDKAVTARSKARIALWAVHMLDEPVAGFTLYALKTSKSFLDYSTLSLKQYGSAAAKTEEKKEEPKAAAAAA